MVRKPNRQHSCTDRLTAPAARLSFLASDTAPTVVNMVGAVSLLVYESICWSDGRSRLLVERSLHHGHDVELRWLLRERDCVSARYVVLD